MGIPQVSASSPASTELSAGVSDSVCTRMVPLAVSVTIACAPVAVSAVTRACSTEQVALGSEKSAPPRNSMPRLSPRRRIAPTATRMITAETMYQVFLRPTKS